MPSVVVRRAANVVVRGRHPLGLGRADEPSPYLDSLRAGLRELGWLEGRNIQIDHRWQSGDAERFRASAAELVGMKPDVIFAGNQTAVLALQQAGNSAPTVFVQVADPVAAGFVASLARPGGNVTGFTNMEGSISAKWLELLKEIAPRVTRVAFLFNPPMAPYAGYYLEPFKTAATSLGVEPITSPVHDTAEPGNGTADRIDP